MIGQQEADKLHRRFTDFSDSVGRAYKRSDNAVTAAANADIWQQTAYAATILSGFTFSVIFCFILWFIFKRR